MGFPGRSKSYLTQTSGESTYVHACVLVHIFVDVNASCSCSWINTVSDTARIIKYCLSLLSGYRPVCVLWVKPKGPSVGTSPHAHTHTHTSLAVLVLAQLQNIYQYPLYITIKWTCWTFNALYSTCQHCSVQTALAHSSVCSRRG